MRVLVNCSNDDKIYLQNLTVLLKARNLNGVATTKTYDITTLQETAKKAQCEAILISNPDTLVACLGAKATLDKFRGTRINYTVPAIVVNPMAHIHTVPYGKWLLEKDLNKFARIKEKPVPFNFLVCDTRELLDAAYSFLETCFLISWDVETNGDSDETAHITCISFTGIDSRGRIGVFVIPFIDFGTPHYTDENLFAYALYTMQRILSLEATKVAFNGIYDSQYSIRHRAEPINYTLDAMILGWSKYSELPRALDFHASIECYDYFFWKDESDKAKDSKDIRSYWAYCAKDSWHTLRVLLSQLSSLESYQIHNYQRTFRLTYPFLYCAFEGVKVNKEKREEVRKREEEKRAKALKDLQLMSANPNFNPGSWQQVHQFIYEVIGAKKPEKTKGAGTDSKTLNRVSMQHPLLARINDLIISYRESAKAISTYCEFTLSKDSRLLYNIDPSGAETGRAASKASNFWIGTQIQNIPEYAKEYIEASEGGMLIEADKNKAEARCVAFLSACEELITDIQGHRDFYKVVTERFFKIPFDQVTKQMRNDVTKHIIHGTHHCMGPEPFIDQATPKKIFEAMVLLKWKGANMQEFVKYLLSLYHRDYPRVKRFWEEDVKLKIMETGKTVSPIGWTRHFFGNPMKNHSVFRAAVAHQSQNLNVDLLNEELWQIYLKLVLPSNGLFRLKAQIHDSIFAQVMSTDKEVVMKYAKEMQRIMTSQKVTIHGREMSIPVDVKIGKVWKNMEEVKLV